MKLKYVFVLIFFCACKNVKTDCQIDDLFTNRIFLEYEKIPSNGYIWGTPMDMIYCDSAIIVFDEKSEDGLFHLVDLNDLDSIGDYNQISYNVMIWDTNTHNIYTPSKRRELTEKYYPFFGYEYEKPSTKPVKIGSDCWIAQNAAILKGTELEDEVIVGFCTILLGTSIPFGTTVVNKVEYRFV